MSDSRLRDLKIKSGVVKRLLKEKSSYEKECTQQSEKVARLEAAADKDEYMIKKQKEVLTEARAMIPDTSRRLTKAIEDLKLTLNGANDLSSSEEHKLAQAVIEDAEADLRQI